MAELIVTLRQEGECLNGKRRTGESVWLVWPSAFWLDGDAIKNGQERVASIGDSLTLLGGNYSYAEIEGRLTNPGPVICRESPALFWVSGIRRDNP